MDTLAALALQLEWGVDEALVDAPRDRRSRATPTLARPEIAVGVAAAPPTLPEPRTTPLARARAIAAAASSRDELRSALAGFADCGLRNTATTLVFEAGDPGAGIVLVADVPRAAEDRTGSPFAGPAAAFLERMLASIGLPMDQVFATSLLPWRPPGDRQPTEAEVQLCLPFLLRHLALLQPRWVLLMGGLGVRTLLPSAGRRAKSTLHQLEVPGLAAPVATLALGAPAHIQATPSAKRDAWASLLRLRRALNTC